MISTTQIQKNFFEIKEKTNQESVLIINISEHSFELVTFSDESYSPVKLAELVFKDPFRDQIEMSDFFGQFIEEFELKSKNYKTININWLNKHFTMVPSSFYVEEKAKEVLEFNVGAVENELVFTNDVLGDIKLIYSIPTELKNAIDKLFPHHNLKHFGFSSIQLFLTHFQLKNTDVFLNVHEQQIELLIKKDKKLLLYNVFNAKSDEDVLYYLLFSIEQFNLNPLTLKLAFSGNRATDDELFKAIKKYLKYAEVVVSDKIIKRKDVFETLPHHYYFSLLNRVLCE